MTDYFSLGIAIGGCILFFILGNYPGNRKSKQEIKP